MSPPSGGVRRAMELRIGSAPEARPWAHRWPTLLVAAVDDLADAAEAHAACRREVFLFHDVTDARDPHAFTDQMAQRVISIGRSLSGEASERILFHCRGGIGRSPAMALGVLASAGIPPADALARVIEARPQAQPNPLVVFRIHRALEADVWHPYLRWASDQPWWRLDRESLRGSDRSIIERLAQQTHRRRPRTV